MSFADLISREGLPGGQMGRSQGALWSTNHSGRAGGSLPQWGRWPWTPTSPWPLVDCRKGKVAGQHHTLRSFQVSRGQTCPERNLVWSPKRNKFWRSHTAKISVIRTRLFDSKAVQEEESKECGWQRHNYKNIQALKESELPKTPHESERARASCSSGFEVRPCKGHLCKSSICRTTRPPPHTHFFFFKK